MPTAIRAAAIPLLPILPVTARRARLLRRGLLFSALLQAAGLVISASPVAEAPPAAVEPVAVLDPQRFAGVWYEIARTPAPDDTFGRHCVRDMSVVYRPAADGTLAVLEQCVGSDGRVRRRDGVAQPDGGRLAVSYAPALLRTLPTAWRDERVVHLDPDYQCVALTDAQGATLRILARSPEGGSACQALADPLERRGLPAHSLMPVSHSTRSD